MQDKIDELKHSIINNDFYSFENNFKQALDQQKTEVYKNIFLPLFECSIINNNPKILQYLIDFSKWQKDEFILKSRRNDDSFEVGQDIEESNKVSMKIFDYLIQYASNDTTITICCKANNLEVALILYKELILKISSGFNINDLHDRIEKPYLKMLINAANKHLSYDNNNINFFDKYDKHAITKLIESDINYFIFKSDAKTIEFICNNCFEGVAEFVRKFEHKDKISEPSKVILLKFSEDNNWNLDIKIEFKSILTFQRICSTQNLELIGWYLSDVHEKDYQEHCYEVLRSACKTGNIKMLKYIISIAKSGNFLSKLLFDKDNLSEEKSFGYVECLFSSLKSKLGHAKSNHINICRKYYQCLKLLLDEIISNNLLVKFTESECYKNILGRDDNPLELKDYLFELVRKYKKDIRWDRLYISNEGVIFKKFFRQNISMKFSINIEKVGVYIAHNIDRFKNHQEWALHKVPTLRLAKDLIQQNIDIFKSLQQNKDHVLLFEEFYEALQCIRYTKINRASKSINSPVFAEPCKEQIFTNLPNDIKKEISGYLGFTFRSKAEMERVISGIDLL
mgnify:FL=1